MCPAEPHRETGAATDAAALSPDEFAVQFKSSARLLWLVAVGIVRDGALADDVVQEAAVVALGKLDQFRPQTNLTAWMSQIVRNVAMNRARKEHRRRAQSLEDDPADQASLHTRSGSRAAAQAASLPDREIDGRILDALGEVSGSARACLLLRTLEGLEYSQIAALLEIPEGTAMSHVHRTRRFLRERLADIAPEAPSSGGGSE